jgi:5-methylcytosine-specific restriction endonuclease McrA
MKTFKLEEYVIAVKNGTSIRSAYKNLYGYYCSSKARQIQFIDKCKQLDLDMSHWTGRRQKNKGHKKEKYLDKDIFCKDSKYCSRNGLIKRLLRDNFIKYECQICKTVLWQNKVLSLHLDHINGVNNDNRIENLRFLCPNCHQQTETWGVKNAKWTQLPDDETLVSLSETYSNKELSNMYIKAPSTISKRLCDAKRKLGLW